METIGSKEFDLAVLIQKQSQAVEETPYFKMPRASQLLYNERRKRIAALREMLGKVKSHLQLRMKPQKRAA